MKKRKISIDFLPDANILKKEPKTEEQKLKLLAYYGESIKEDEFYADDHVLVATSNNLGININILYKDSLLYKSLNYYQTKLKKIDTLNLLFINGEQFRTLFKKKQIN